MVPFVIVHVYVVPNPAYGTDAQLFPDSEQTVDDALIVAEGIGLMNTLYVPEYSVHPLTLTIFTDNFT